MMISDDAAHRIESEPRSFANSFGGEKWLEDMGQNSGRNSGSVVANLDQYAVEFPRGTHPQFALPMHGLDGVGHQVGPNLIELAAEGADARQAFVIFAKHGDTGLEFMVQNRKCIFESLMKVDFLHRSLIHIRVLFDCLD